MSRFVQLKGFTEFCSLIGVFALRDLNLFRDLNLDLSIDLTLARRQSLLLNSLVSFIIWEWELLLPTLKVSIFLDLISFHSCLQMANYANYVAQWLDRWPEYWRITVWFLIKGTYLGCGFTSCAWSGHMQETTTQCISFSFSFCLSLSFSLCLSLSLSPLPTPLSPFFFPLSPPFPSLWKKNEKNIL